MGTDSNPTTARKSHSLMYKNTTSHASRKLDPSSTELPLTQLNVLNKNNLLPRNRGRLPPTLTIMILQFN